jgi:homoserine O-acetyltransferase
VGDRRFAPIAEGRRFVLEGGSALREARVAYETWGTLRADGSNAVLVCHALTGDSHAAGPAGDGHPTPGWWDDLIGPGKAIDTERWFVVCANVVGGCQGSTGPASTDPDTGRPYGSSFGVVTVRDMVRSQQLLADHLGVGRWLAVVGGSMGGMQVLEWAVMFPERVAGIVPIATNARASAQQIAYSAIGRRAVVLDPGWCGGDYYDQPPGRGPARGLAVARALAHVTYRTDEVFESRFGREEVAPLDVPFDPWHRFQVESYLDYQGAKLARRFDANSYLLLNKAMDIHDLGRKRGGVDRALSRVRVPALTMSISSDALYWPDQQAALTEELRGAGVPVREVRIDSPHGHDAFLLEPEQVGPPITEFIEEIERHG